MFKLVLLRAILLRSILENRTSVQRTTAITRGEYCGGLTESYAPVLSHSVPVNK